VSGKRAISKAQAKKLAGLFHRACRSLPLSGRATRVPGCPETDVGKPKSQNMPIPYAAGAAASGWNRTDTTRDTPGSCMVTP
jgi:hypothetical protein